MLSKIESRIVRNDIKNLTLFIHVFEFVITLFGIHHPVHFLRRFFSFSFSRWRSFWVYRCRCNTIASVHLHFWVRKIYAAHWFGVAWVAHYLLNCSAFNCGKIFMYSITYVPGQQRFIGKNSIYQLIPF